MVKKIKQQGFVLVLSLVMLASMSLIGTLLVFSSNEEMTNSEGSFQHYQSYYAAETAIFAGRSYLQQNISRLDNFQPKTIGTPNNASQGFSQARSTNISASALSNSTCTDQFTPISNLVTSEILPRHDRYNFWNFLIIEGQAGNIPTTSAQNIKQYFFEFYIQRLGVAPLAEGFSVQAKSSYEQKEKSAYAINACGMFDGGTFNKVIPIQKVLYANE
jgi:Tfp pilus assembly protein PilX